MDLNDIKQLINSNKERIIIVENGKPVVVLISFAEYQKNFRNSEKSETKQTTEEKEEETKKELTIEDLPF